VKGYPDYAEPDVGAISAAPCAEKEGQPDDAESGARRGHEGGVPVEKPVLYYERRRRRAAASATETAVTTFSPFLQGGEAVARDGRKRRTTVAVPMATDKEEVVPVDGGADEGGGKSARLRVKETLRAFSSYYLHFVQVALFPLSAGRWENISELRFIKDRFPVCSCSQPVCLRPDMV
jgi:euchromatic histone-lysine N-methyltransferase